MTLMVRKTSTFGVELCIMKVVGVAQHIWVVGSARFASSMLMGSGWGTGLTRSESLIHMNIFETQWEHAGCQNLR